MKFLNWMSASLLVALLAACGGGGGSSGTSPNTVVISTSTGSTSTFVTPTVASLSLSALTASTTTLPSGGNASLSVTALSNGQPTSTPVNVSFLASCGTINGQAVSSSTAVAVTTNGSGIAQVTYSAISSTGVLCSGNITVTANAVNSGSTALNLTVAAPIANSIQFISATPARIFVAGSGAIERSEVVFRVFAASGIPLNNVNVGLSLVTNPGGAGIGSAGSTANITAQSDSNGDVRVGVFSGTIPGPVKLKAALSSNNTLFAESQNLTVASGPPSQRFMSLSVEKFNIEGWAVDGNSTALTVRIADRQGNSVQDGTVVNFTAEGGQVASSCATTTNNGISSCSVQFISQNPRPVGGRVSVVAYLEGTKDYTDNNGNNIYDAGVDTLQNLGDVFRDDNEDGVFNAGEFVISRGGNASCAGTAAPFPSRANTCDNVLATTVRQQTVILFSSSSPMLTNVTLNSGVISAIVRSTDNALLPMPAGTTITAEASGGTCAVDKQFGSPVVNVSPGINPAADIATAFQATLKTCSPGNVVFISVTSPGGLKTTFGGYVIP